MTDNRTAWGDSMQAAASALDQVMARLDAVIHHPNPSPGVSRLVEDIHPDVRRARDELSTVAYGYALEQQLADQLADALRLTAEWSMAIALPGWSWFDAMTSYHAHRGWDKPAATGRPCGVSEHEEAEALWNTERIHQVLADPLVQDTDRQRALRHLARHAQLDSQVAVAVASEEADGPQPPTPDLGDERGPVRGVPFLLEQLGLLAKESVYLWFNPERSKPWAIWTGAPAGTGGGQWGEGRTAQAALGDAFANVTRAIFDGRVVR